MAAAALQALAITSPTLYLSESSPGTTVLTTLHGQCLEAKLLSAPSAADDAEKLYGLFNVAVDHGLGSLVLDYIAQVCFRSGPAPAHPSFPILTDPQRMVIWLHSSLAAARHDLSTALAQGIRGLASSHVASRHVTKLQTLAAVAEALASRSHITTAGPATTTSRTARRILTEAGLGSTTAATDSIEALVEEARRLLQAAQVMRWISSQELRHVSPSGRFSSQAAWQGTVNRRRAGASPSPLFLTDLLDELTHYDIDPPAYPPYSPESFISALFFSGDATLAAFEAKLAVLAYGLVDANFFTAPDLAESLRCGLGIRPSTVISWILLLFLDDVQLVSPDAPVNSSLIQAVNCLPGVNAPKIPFRALRIFLERGRGDVALALLRQRGDTENSDVGSACTALRIRLANGLFVEAFVEMQRHLESIPEVHRRQHAQQLIEELLQWGAAAEGFHAIIRLPISLQDAEPALITWLQNATSHIPQTGLLLTLYLLIRGRAPEALLAYAEYGRTAREDPSLSDACGQLEELLRAAARMMPAAQRALVVGTALEPALVLPSQGDSTMGEAEGGVAVASALPGLETGGIPSLISVGPSQVEAPLVGGILAAGARAQMRSPPVSKAGAAGGGGGIPPLPAVKPAAPLLFGTKPQAGTPAAVRAGTGFGQFGSVLKTATAAAGTPQTGGRRQHQLDALLGVAPVSGSKSGIKDRKGLR